MASMAAASRPPAQVSLAALFLGFLKIGLFGVGGQLAIVHRVVIDERGWLGEADFADILSLCQFMPGPNFVNVAVCVGSRLRGTVGALVGLVGFVALPGVIGFTIGVLYFEFAQSAVVQRVFGGVSAAAAGLMMATGLRLLLPHRRRPAAVAFAALAFLGLAIVHLPLLVVLAVLVPLSIGAAWLRRSPAT